MLYCMGAQGSLMSCGEKKGHELNSSTKLVTSQWGKVLGEKKQVSWEK